MKLNLSRLSRGFSLKVLRPFHIWTKPYRLRELYIICYSIRGYVMDAIADASVCDQPTKRSLHRFRLCRLVAVFRNLYLVPRRGKRKQPRINSATSIWMMMIPYQLVMAEMMTDRLSFVYEVLYFCFDNKYFELAIWWRGDFNWLCVDWIRLRDWFSSYRGTMISDQNRFI